MLSKGSYLIEEKLLKGSYQREVIEGELLKGSYQNKASRASPTPKGLFMEIFPIA